MSPGPPPWEGNPYSALALFPEEARELQALSL
ncbi:membrane protein insertion efficiency factor YidD, partial [Corallococcus sp. CA041A]